MDVCRRTSFTIVALIALLAIIAGCGSSSDSSNASGSPASNGEVGASLPAPTAEAPSGEPIVIADITDVSYPGAPFVAFPESAQVAVDYVNKYLGGVDGRPLELWTCDSKNEPAATSTCANETLQQDPVAQVGLSILLAENGAKQLHENDIPTFNVPNNPAEASSEKTYPLGGGSITEYPAMGYYAGEKLGAKRMGVLQPEEAAGHYFAELIGNTANAAGIEELNESYYKTSGADIVPAVAKAITGKPDLAGMTVPPGLRLPAYKAFQQQGYPSEQMFGVGDQASAATLESAGSAVDGMQFTFEFENYDDLSNPQVKTYRAAMEELGPSVDARREFALWSFANIVTIAEALEAAKGEPTGKTLIEYMESTKRIPVFAGNDLEESAAPQAAPSIWNPEVIVIRWNADEKEFENASNGFFSPPVE